MRLIDADKLLNDYQELADCDFVHPLYENTLRDIIDDAPTVEVCEDCVSRADVLGLAKKGVLVSNNNYQAVCKAINMLPSVTPSYNSIKTELKPCEDCISRKAVETAFHDLGLGDEENGAAEYMCGLWDAYEAIKSLPPVTPQQTRWIPVTERMPKYGKDVLTCNLEGFIEIQSLEYNVWDEYSYWENQKGDWTDFDEVIAWQPLPQPYKESEDKE